MDRRDSNSFVIKKAQEVLKIESQALKEQIPHIHSSFAQAVNALYAITMQGGQIIVMGVGKSGLIGRKISATLSSTGTPSVFFHPAEGLHGDLGMIHARDGVIAISWSGETEEIKKVMPILKEKKLTVIAITSKEKSRLGRSASIVIRSVARIEACPHNLTPTASTTVTLALGDALAMALMEKRGFQPADFARLHPGGSLGKRLSYKVGDLMRQGDENPKVLMNRTVRDALLEMSRTRLGATNIIDGNGKLVGFFTDGDLRRKLEKDEKILNKILSTVMTKNPRTISPNQSLHDALHLLKMHQFDNLPVTDRRGKAIGILDERDLLAEGIV